MSAGGAKLQPIAALCAVLVLIWGAFAVAAVVAQIQINDRFDLWPQGMDSWGDWLTILAFAGAALGVPAVLTGPLGLRRRAGLHVGALLALASTVVTLVWMTIEVTKFQATWSEIASHYRRNILWQETPPARFERWWFFVNDVMLPLGVLVVLLWLLVLASGVGRRSAGSTGLGYAYVAAPQADYRYVVAPDAPGAPAAPAAPDAPAQARGEDASGREVPPVTEPRDAPAPLGSAAEFAPAEVAPVEDAEAEPATDDIRAADDTRPADDERVWFVTVQGADHGPYSRTQLQGYVDEGRLHAGTITHLAGGEDRALADVLA